MKTKITPDIAKKLYTALVRCRKFDDKIVELFPQQEMRCPTHLSLGQEAVAAGVCVALEESDLVFSTHRCHSHTIAKGGSFNLMMAELYGRVTGCSKGKGGSMHFVQPEVGIMGASAIVGGTVPLAVGAALAAKMRSQNIVTVPFFGDGGIEGGAFHESMNFASLKKLPVLFVCENNGVATCSLLNARQVYGDLYKRADGYQMPGIQVDGTKADEVYLAAKGVIDNIRKGKGPALLEALCYRWKEHVGPNFDYQLGYRTKEELESWMKKDPVKRFENFSLKKKLLLKDQISQINASIESELEASIIFAKNSAFPDKEALLQDI